MTVHHLLSICASISILVCGGLPLQSTRAFAATIAGDPVNLTAVWANDGGDKVTRDELRVSKKVTSVANRLWDGSQITMFGAKNEVVNFNLILEAAKVDAANVSFTFNQLTGPSGALIGSIAATGNGVFDWTERNIENFFVRYLQIKGIGGLSYETSYDERHVPKRFQRPWSGAGIASGTWTDRPDHDKYYPEIAVPLEAVPTFTIVAGQNQSIWSDIYIPKTAVAGIYTGTVTVAEAGHVSYQIPVSLLVRGFTLPDAPTSKTMMYLGYQDINKRYTGQNSPRAGTPQGELSQLVRNRHFQMAHRHKLSIIDSNEGLGEWDTDAPRPDWLPKLDGSLFTAANGYAGPGVATGNGIYSIGTYSSWSWNTGSQRVINTHSDNWVKWFTANAPGTEYFLYLIDESANYPQTQGWAASIRANPGVGRDLMSFATIALPTALAQTNGVDIIASTMDVGDTATWQNAFDKVRASGKKFYMYNGKRPAEGSFATEDDGVALRELAWGQYKKGIDRWFTWESAYYNDTQGGRGQTDVMNNAESFGGPTHLNAEVGQTGYNSTNGEGVLFYPGTDTVYPASSYGLQGPIASLRMKHWRRGVQDVDYIAQAMAVNPMLTTQIVSGMVPKALWENGIDDQSDPTWKRCDISWSTNPDDWETARSRLADIIEGARGN